MKHEAFIQALRVHAAVADRIYSKATAAYLRGAADRMEAMAEALEPFAADDFEHPIVDEHGWTEFGISWSRERIVDWFGPSAFRRARQALSLLGQDGG